MQLMLKLGLLMMMVWLKALFSMAGSPELLLVLSGRVNFSFFMNKIMYIIHSIQFLFPHLLPSIFPQLVPNQLSLTILFLNYYLYKICHLMSQQAAAVTTELLPTQTDVSGFKSTLSNLGDYILNAKSQLSDYTKQIQNSQSCQTISGWKNDFRREVCTPIGDIYRQLPGEMTSFKMNLLQSYSTTERFAFINLVCVLTAIVTFKRMPDYGLTQKTLRAFRNSGVMYLVGGLFVTPEIYNPIMKE